MAVKDFPKTEVCPVPIDIKSLTNSGWDSSEGRYAYRVAQQIVENGRLGFDVQPISGVFTKAPNGIIYASHEFGNAFFMLPTAFLNLILKNILSSFISQNFIEIIQKYIVSFQSGVYSATTAVTFFSILRIGFAQRVIPSFVATLCLATTTYFWTYSRDLYDTVLCSTLLTLSFLFILKYKEENRWIYLIGSFIFVGFGFITRTSMILVIITSLFYLTIITRKTKLLQVLSTAFLTLSPFLIWQSWYNHLRTGIFYISPVQTAKYASTNALDGNVFVGLAGLIFSPGKSIFVYAPLLILSVFLFHKFLRQHQKEALYILLLTTMWLLLHAKLRSWYGAWGWGPRHFITILPILFLPFAVNIVYAFRHIKLKILLIILATFGFLLSVSSIISNWYFRMKIAKITGRDGDDVLIWGFWNSQAVDMLKASVENIYRILTNSAIIEIPGTPIINSYGSSTIYVWPNMLIYFGIPWYLVAFLVITLLTFMFFALKNIFGSENDMPSEARGC